MGVLRAFWRCVLDGARFSNTAETVPYEFQPDFEEEANTTRAKTIGPACWEELRKDDCDSGYALPKSALRRKFIDLTQRKYVKTSAGVWHVSDGGIHIDYVPDDALIGNRGITQVSTLAEAVAEPTWVASNVAVDAANHLSQQAVAGFTDPAVIDALNSVDWTSFPLPEAIRSIVDSLALHGMSFGTALAEAVVNVTGHATLILPLLRLYAYYTQELDPAHDSRRAYAVSKRAFKLPPLPPVETTVQHALRSYNNFMGLNSRTAIDPALYAARSALRGFTDDDPGQRQLLNVATAQAMEIVANNKIELQLSNDIGEITMGLLSKRFPEFSVKMVSRRHVHGVQQAVRHAFNMLIFNEVAMRRHNGLSFIGAVPSQVARFDLARHNCAPLITGRDDYRHNIKASKADKEHFDKISHHCKFEDCNNAIPGSIGVALHSASDIGAEAFLRTMIRKGMPTAFVVVNLPVPMLDKRIVTYRDDWLGVHYERRGDKLNMYHTGGASAGYSNDFDKAMSWCRPLPHFEGFHVQVEEVRRFGTSFMLEINIGIGEQEITPTMWRVTDDQFYIMPVLNDLSIEPEEQWYVVPRHRFENIVSFAMAPGTSKTDMYSIVANKIRGQQAELKIGNQVVEPRWEMSLEEFQSTIAHALTAAAIRLAQSKSSLSRMKWAHWRSLVRNAGMGFGLAFALYVIDLFTFRKTGENFNPNKLPFWSRVIRFLTASSLNHEQMVISYHLAGEYRVINELTEIRTPSILRDWCEVANFMKHIGKRTLSQSYYWADKVGQFFELLPDNGSEWDVPCGNDRSADDYVNSGGFERPSAPHVATVIADDLSEGSSPGEVNSIPPVAEEREREEVLSTASDREYDNPAILATSLVLDLDLDNCYSDSIFRPDGPLFKTIGGSTSNDMTWANFDNAQSMKDALLAGRHLDAPDSGVLELVTYAIDKSKNDETIINDFDLDGLMSSTKALTAMDEYVDSFLEIFKSGDRTVRLPVLNFFGVAGSAKSSVMRSYIKERPPFSVVVVVPTKKLAHEWRDNSKGIVITIVTQHAIAKVKRVNPSVIVMDEVFAMELPVIVGWMIYAHRVNAKLVFLGESNQSYHMSNTILVRDFAALRQRTIDMRVSNTMPQDVVAYARQLFPGKFDDVQTRNKIKCSVKVIDGSAMEMFDSEGYDIFKSRTTDTMRHDFPGLESAPSITQVQGTRFKKAMLYISPIVSTHSWLVTNPNQMYVALSRHSEELVMAVNAGDQRTLLNCHMRVYRPVNGYAKEPSKKTLFCNDVLLEDTEPRSDNGIHIDHIVSSERLVSHNRQEDSWVPEVKAVCSVSHSEIEDVIAPHVQHSRLFDHAHAIDLHIPSPGTLSSCRYDFTIKANAVARCGIPDAEGLAVHQSADNSFDDLRNVALRQTSVKRKNFPDATLAKWVAKAYALFRSSYIADEYVTYAPGVDAQEWLDTRTNGFLSKLADAACYGEAAHTVGHHCFLKTQDKVKPESGFSASLTHGQTVIASDESYNAYCGPVARHLIASIQDSVRSGVVIDVGYSDQQLGRLLRENGSAAAFHDLGNVQIDISRQDSSHNAVTLAVFGLVMADCGIDDGFIQHYLLRRVGYKIRSLSPGLYKGQLSYNLPSGDPFTLICNIIQEMTTTAERFDLREHRFSLHKGDDCIFEGHGLRDRVGSVVWPLRDVTLKVAVDLPPYHAGRFILRDDVCIDPVRRFLKHYGRSINDNVSNSQYYAAALDWRFTPSDYQVRYLTKACAVFYDDFSESDIDVMIRACVQLRDVRFFNDSYPLGKRVENNVIVEREYKCARYMLEVFAPHVSEQAKKEVESMEWLDCQRKLQQLIPDVRVRLLRDKVTHRASLERGIYVSKDHAFAVCDPINFNN